MEITVLFFATLKDRAGLKKLSLELESGAQVRELKARLLEKFPSLDASMATCVIAVNHEFAGEADVIPDGAEVALFPPVSGGSTEKPTLFYITEEILDLNWLLDQITLPSTGAACLFTGMVRGSTLREGAHETQYLEYEAYRPMAEAKMHQVAEEIRQRWPMVEGIAIVQRIGRLYPGTPTVIIACSSSHRDSGVFEAARYGIDRLKEIVPIWKKEVGPQGEEWVEGDYIPRSGE